MNAAIMEFGEEKELGIDPEVRAFVFSLVSAVSTCVHLNDNISAEAYPCLTGL